MQAANISLSPKLFSHLCSQISSGMGVWAMFTANEYMNPNCLLRKAMIQRTKQVYSDKSQYDLIKSVIPYIEAGHRLSQLSPIKKKYVRFISDPKTIVPKLKPFRGKVDLKARERLRNTSDNKTLRRSQITCLYHIQPRICFTPQTNTTC